MFSSMAISRIPVSTVHTIKVYLILFPQESRLIILQALSPLFTVVAYALLFRVSYSMKTYISLLPLTLGVMLACSFDMSASNTIGLLCAFGSAIVFVSSNIFFKKIMPSKASGISQSSSHKLDKLNLLLYSSGMAFLLMIPIWLYYDLPVFLAAKNSPEHITHPNHGHVTPHSVTYYFFMNGTVHFAQNIIAFIILSSTSPVTYSIASLIKRVAVICIAIVWFNQTVHPIQAFGIAMTFLGLYMYNNAKGDVEKGENKMRRAEAARDMMLPTTKADSQMMDGTEPSPLETIDKVMGETTGLVSPSVYGRPRGVSSAGLKHPPPIPNHHPQPHSHLHSIPSLSVKITAPSNAAAISPTDSYPSPPTSLDSPPSKVAPLPGLGGGHGRAYGHGHGHGRRLPDVQEIMGVAA
jgi:solute carrier family 35 protein E1